MRLEMMLTRKDKLLKLIVEDFIKTAEPVGSNYLIKKYDLPISSATIRNEMNALEKEGLLEKTHISSGRVPSTKGYEYYIEHLRNNKIDDKMKNELNKVFSNSITVEEILKESCEILSHMTNLASVVLGPSAEEEHLVSIQLIPLSLNSVTAIFVTDRGYVENKTFTITSKYRVDDLKKCIEILNERLKGTRINALVDKLESIKPILSDYMSDYAYLYNALLKTFYDFASSRNGTFYGKENLLKQPEFKDNANELKKLFDLFENPSDLEKIIDEAQSRLLVNAGDVEEKYNDVSVVSKDIAVDGEKIGKIAVIGPTRMDYSKVLNSLDYIVDRIMECLSNDNIQEKKGGEDGRE